MSFWTKLRDAVESVAVIAGNVVLPGSSLVSSQLVSKGAQKNLSSDLGKVAQLGSGVYGGLPTDMGGAGNFSNYGTGYDKLTGMFTGGADAAGLVGTDAAAMSSAPGAAMDAYGNYVPASYTLGDASITGGGGAAAGGGFLNNLAGAASNYLVPGAILGSSLIGAGAAKSAANTQAAAQQQANQLLAQQYQQQRADLQPYSAAGVNALSKFQGMADYTPFGTSQFQADPGYAFRLSEGQKALERSAAARGGLLSGGTGKRIAAYGQEAASQEYQNAFNRYQTERAAKLAPYQSLINTGQASAAGQANAAGNYGTQAAQGLTNIGGAQAAGTMGGANALASGLGQYLNYNANQDLATAVRQSGYGR